MYSRWLSKSISEREPEPEPEPEPVVVPEPEPEPVVVPEPESPRHLKLALLVVAAGGVLLRKMSR